MRSRPFWYINTQIGLLSLYVTQSTNAATDLMAELPGFNKLLYNQGKHSPPVEKFASKLMKNYLPVSIIILLSWSLPLYMILNNRLSPSFETALAVAYGFLLGCVIHFLLIILWVAIRRTKLQRTETIVLLSSLLIMILLTVIGDTGTFSTMGFQGLDLAPFI